MIAPCNPAWAEDAIAYYAATAAADFPVWVCSRADTSTAAVTSSQIAYTATRIRSAGPIDHVRAECAVGGQLGCLHDHEDHEGDQRQRRGDEQRRLQVFEDFIANGPHPMTVDLEGAEVVSMDRSPARTYVLVGGGMVEVEVDAWGELANPLTRCTSIAAPGQPHELTDTLEDFATWCTVSGPDAVLVDGTGVSQIRDDLLVLAHTVEHAAKLDPNARPATADEVQAVFDALRPMTEAELRAAFAP